jgi:hypothetical protein
MTTHDQVDDTLQRVGLAALMYYPEIHVEEPDYTVDTDVDWCLEPLSALPAEQLQTLRDVIGRTIVNPTEHRATVFQALQDLLPND